MLLDLRVLLSASFAAVLILLGGFGMIAILRTPGKPSTAILIGSEEITGAIGKRGEKAQSLTDDDKTVQPARAAPDTVRAANLEKTEKTEKEKSEKAQAPEGADEKAAQAKAAVAKPRPRIQAARPEIGANFKANNPFAFPFGGAGLGQQ